MLDPRASSPGLPAPLHSFNPDYGGLFLLWADVAPLPWDVLAQLDAGMPQCYTADGNKEPGFVERCVDSYRKLGFSAVIPTLRASETLLKAPFWQSSKRPRPRLVSYRAV